ncbi:hypothetical protein BOX15_Mlig008835g2 [Macrostomum lignano]|uniref:WH2 domain-containing protein n=2 Tax=Macrostomum lignano TaxID=282301 RepID=A0A1I8HWH2_9PLAT|nr:hypothetical protein BOX15_Mlig008835g2 [Macrostomum lignano]
MSSDTEAEEYPGAGQKRKNKPPQLKQSGLYLTGLLDAAPPPPPSPEKTQRAASKTRQHQLADPVVRGESARIELEVEKLLENSTRWRRTRQPRIRTPVRRAVLHGQYSLSASSARSGRRHAVLRDLSTRVRELEVDALSRGIASSVAMLDLDQEDAARISVVGSARLDPRVRNVYREIMPVSRAKTMTELQSESAGNGGQQTATKAAGATAAVAVGPLPNRDGGLPTRQSSRRRRLQSVRSQAATNNTNNTTNDSSAFEPVRRAKTSITMPTATNSARSELLRQRQINGEVQRSLYMERTHGLRRLLQPGADRGGDQRDGAGNPLMGGLVGVGSGVRR